MRKGVKSRDNKIECIPVIRGQKYSWLTKRIV